MGQGRGPGPITACGHGRVRIAHCPSAVDEVVGVADARRLLVEHGRDDDAVALRLEQVRG
jgi:hypothetical protein